MREVIETSSFEFQIIPISVDGTSDLQAMALGHLVLHLPWDELQRKMTLEKLKSAGIGVDAGLATIVAPLLKIGANASFEARRKVVDEYEFKKTVGLAGQVQIVDVVNLFFEWSKRASLDAEWDAVMFYLYLDSCSQQQAESIFRTFLNDIALDIHKRICVVVLPNTRIDFGVITTALRVLDHSLPPSVDAFADVLYKLAEDRLQSMGKIGKLVRMRGYRTLHALVKEPDSRGIIRTLLQENDFDLYEWGS